jgi:uncharacterized protein (DUF433 family)
MSLHTDPVPLRIDETGTLRVGASRVTLDALLQYWRMGMMPEAIAQGLDTLTPADVHGALAYYHRHQEEIDEYLHRRAQNAEALRQEIEAANAERLASFKKRMDAIRAEENGARPMGCDASAWTDVERDLLRAEALEALGWQGMEAYQDDE